MPDEIEIMRWEDEGGLPDLSEQCHCNATSKFGGTVVWCPTSGWADHPRQTRTDRP